MARNVKDPVVDTVKKLDAAAKAEILMTTPGWQEIIRKYVDAGKKDYPKDPVEFMRDTLGYAMWPKLEEICRSVENNTATVVASGFGVGKCQGWDDDVFLADGSVVPAGSLVGKHFRIVGFDLSNWEMRPMDAWAEDNGIQDVYEVVLDSGQIVNRTGNHPLLTWNGWKAVNDLFPGDRIAVPIGLPSPESSTVELSDNEIISLAYMIAEGGIKYKQTSVSQSSGAVFDEMKHVFGEMNCEMIAHPSNPQTYRIRGCKIKANNGGVKWHNSIRDLCNKFGLLGKGSFDKFVPQEIFRLPNNKISLFLNRLFACDGWISSTVDKRGKSHDELGYCSASYRLASDVRILLSRMGIYARVRRKYSKKFKTYSWSVYTVNSTGIIKFFNTVGYPLGKENQSEIAHRSCLEKPNSNRPNRLEHDLLPESAWDGFKHDRYQKDGLWSASIRLRIKNGKHPSRNTVKRYENITGRILFNGWSNSNVGWSTIKSITHVGKLATVAISVPETQAYVTHVIDHNSISASAIVAWWMCTRDPAVVVTLAPTSAQVNDILWRYLRIVGERAKLPGEIFRTPRWRVSTAREAYGLSANKTSEEDMGSIQGRHDENMLVVLDEGAAMNELVWRTVIGLIVGSGNKVLVIGNPVSRSGPFFDACTSPNWNHIRISCFDHPNVVEGREVVPGAVTRRWIEDRANEWGTPCEAGTPGAVKIWWLDKWIYPQSIFVAKVLGIAPDTSEDQFIPLNWIVDAENNEDIEPGENVVLGLDPAPRGGDDTAIVARRGNYVMWVKRRKISDTNDIVDWAAREIAETGAVKIFIDESGSGIGVVDVARKRGLPIYAVNGSRNASQRKRFGNLKSECWWRLRELLRTRRMRLPQDTHLEADLSAPLWREDSSSRMCIEEKEKLVARIGRSTDSGDALATTYSLPSSDDNTVMAGVQRELSNVNENKLPSSHHGGSRWVVNRVSAIGSRWRR